MSSCLLFWSQRRCIVCFFIFLAFSFSYIMRINLSIVLVTLAEQKTSKKNNSRKFLNWTKAQQANVLSSFVYGYVGANFPGGCLAYRIGGKIMLFCSILMGSILTLLVPVCANWNYYALLSNQILIGIAQGPMVPSLFALISKWVLPTERTQFSLFVLNGWNVGMCLCIHVTSAMCKTIGWQWAFYVIGLFGLIWCFLWIFLISESPLDDKRITKDELILLQNALNISKKNNKNNKIPWNEIFTSSPVWALTASLTGFAYGFYLVLFHFPYLMKETYGLTGLRPIYLTLPYYIAVAMNPISASLADKFIRDEYLSIGHVRKLFTCGSFIFQTFVATTAVCWMTPTGSIICVCLITGIGSFSWAGFWVNHLDICPQYACITVGITNTIASTSPLFGSIFFKYLVNGTLADVTKISGNQQFRQNAASYMSNYSKLSCSRVLLPMCGNYLMIVQISICIDSLVYAVLFIFLLYLGIQR